MIRVKDLKKIYRVGDQEIRAVDGVSFEIQKGEMVAVMGSSGSGKSTLMHIIGCLDRPTSGEYYLEGEDINRLDSDELADLRGRKIGFVFQAYNLLPRTTALENVEVPLMYGKVSRARTKAMEALERVGLADRAGHLSNQLSGGQGQRVAIARALVTEPAIILADEPTGNLDSRTGKEIMVLFKNLHDQGVTLTMVTHEPDVAGLCERTLRIRDGKLIEDGAK